MAAPDNPPPVQQTGFRPEVKPPPPEQETGYHIGDIIRHRHETTASTLAYVLIATFVGVIVLHYVCLTILLYYQRQNEVTTLEHLFNALLPVVAGLASSAATYYFTKEGR